MQKADEAEASSKLAPEMIPPSGKGANASPAMPAEILVVAREAKGQFERAKYRDAEKTYLKAQAKAPNNVYMLSNLGVTQFRQQKYKLAEESFKKAIANAPEVVLADEPTANLDSGTAAGVLDLMRDLNTEQRVSFVVATHDPRVVARARRVVALRDGRIVDGA